MADLKTAPACPPHLVKTIDNKCMPCGTLTIEGYPTHDVGTAEFPACVAKCPDDQQPYYHPRWQYWTCLPICPPGTYLDPDAICQPMEKEKPASSFPWLGVIGASVIVGGAALYLRSQRTGR
jgi:hypothetical protein